MRTIRFEWVSALQISLDFPERTGGSPLTWNAAFVEDSNGTWRVDMDFADRGSVGFTCNEARLVSD